jgi:hypothetical protein
MPGQSKAADGRTRREVGVLRHAVFGPIQLKSAGSYAASEMSREGEARGAIMAQYKTFVRLDFPKLCERLSRQFKCPVGPCRAQHWLRERGFTFDGTWQSTEPGAARHFHRGELLEAWEVEAWEVQDMDQLRFLNHIQYAPSAGPAGENWGLDRLFVF